MIFRSVLILPALTRLTVQAISTSTSPLARFSQFFRHVKSSVRLKRLIFCSRAQRFVAAGYCMYGPQTILVLTIGRGVVMFTLDDETGIFRQTAADVTVPREAAEFAINMSNQRFWEKPVQRYISELLAGKDGPRGKNFNMRWIAAMVAEVHRILMRGGIFMYPRDSRNPERAGKLRPALMKPTPCRMIMEQAGAAATNGHVAIRTIKPTSIHERVAVFLAPLRKLNALPHTTRIDHAVFF